MPSKQPPQTERRIAIADAAIAVLGEGGSRALTHRAVDRRLGLPEGSTSAYYRTRRALMEAALTRRVHLDLERTMSLDLTATSLPEAAQMIAAMIEAAVSAEGRVGQLARYELGLEASRNEWLRADLAGARDLFVHQAERLLLDAGCKDPRKGAPVLALFINTVVLDLLVHGEQSAIPQAELAEQIERILSAY